MDGPRAVERARPAGGPVRRLRRTLFDARAWLRLEREDARADPGTRSPARDVLLLAWAFPPRVDGGVYRPVALARHLGELGWAMRVAAGPAPADPSDAGRRLREQVDPSVAVHRFRRPAAAPFRRLLPRLDGGSLNMVEWVDQIRDWIGAGGPPGIILASGPPFHGFVAARFLARAFGSRLVLDYRDEWTECPFSFVRTGLLDRRYERRCLSAADAVVFTTRSALAHQRASFAPPPHADWRVIPNGWEPSEHASSEPAPAGPPGGTLRLCFAGNMASYALPGPFLDAVEGLLAAEPRWRDRLRLLFIGPAERQARSQLSRFPFPEMLEQMPLLPRGEAHRLMRRASALVLFNPPPFDRYLPGKLYDYVACRRPLLVFGERRGEIARLVAGLGVGRIVAKPSELAAALAELDAGVGAGDEAAVARWLAEHTRRRMAERFAALFEALVGPAEPRGPGG